jgi:hypothetical protein
MDVQRAATADLVCDVFEKSIPALHDYQFNTGQTRACPNRDLNELECMSQAE